MFNEDTVTSPTKVVLSLKRCAMRCGALAKRHDIYCEKCRKQITDEVRWLIDNEPLPENLP